MDRAQGHALAPAAGRQRPPSPLRVVIADDSAEQRVVLRQLVESMGCSVVEAADGRALFWTLEALERAEPHEPVLVLADLRMPVYNGLDVLEAWREAAPRVPFVLITSFPDDDVERRVHELGGLLVAKPFPLARIQEVVKLYC